MIVDFDNLVNGVCIATFGEQAQAGGKVTYTPQGGAPFQIDGIFDAAWADVSIGRGRHGAAVAVSTTAPRLGVRASDVPPGVSLSQGDTYARANGDVFAVQDVNPDGFGYVYLISTQTSD